MSAFQINGMGLRFRRASKLCEQLCEQELRGNGKRVICDPPHKESAPCRELWNPSGLRCSRVCTRNQTSRLASVLHKPARTHGTTAYKPTIFKKRYISEDQGLTEIVVTTATYIGFSDIAIQSSHNLMARREDGRGRAHGPGLRSAQMNRGSQ